jgi:hypothetical protein
MRRTRCLSVVLLLLSVSCGRNNTPTGPTPSEGGGNLGPQQGVCGYRVDQQQLTQNMGFEGGELRISVTVTQPTCSWSSASNADFITIEGGAGTSTGSREVKLVVARNDGAERTGTVAIANVTFTIRQATPPCQFRVASSTTRFTDAGGNGAATIAVTQGVNCAWTAASEASFITNVSPSSGSGNADVSFSVGRNTGTEARTGVLRIAGETLSVSQDAFVPPLPEPCTFIVSPTRFDLSAHQFFAAPHRVTVTASRPDCAWNVQMAPSVFNIAPLSGSGSASIQFQVASNVFPAPRTLMLGVAGQSITISQPAFPCIPDRPRNFDVPASGGTFQIPTGGPAICGWQIRGADAFLQVSPSAGAPGVVIVVTVPANTTGALRRGNVTLGMAEFGLTSTFGFEQRAP